MTIDCFYIYILHCENGAYYTGYTTDLMRRYQEHQLGTAKCKFTRSFKPLRIAHSWKIQGTKATALKIEKFIKAMTKKQKIALLQQPQNLFKLVEPYLK